MEVKPTASPTNTIKPIKRPRRLARSDALLLVMAVGRVHLSDRPGQTLSAGARRIPCGPRGSSAGVVTARRRGYSRKTLAEGAIDPPTGRPYTCFNSI